MLAVMQGDVDAMFFLASLWAEGRWTQGRLDGRVDVLTPAKGPFEVKADLAVQGLGLETPTGWLAAADLRGRMAIDYRGADGRQRVDTPLKMPGGGLLSPVFNAPPRLSA